MFRGQYFVQFVKLSINDFPISVLPFLYTSYNIILIKRKIATAVTNVAKQKKKKIRRAQCIRLKKERQRKNQNFLSLLSSNSRCIYSHTRLTIVNKDTRRHVPSREREKVCNANQESMRRNGWFMHPVLLPSDYIDRCESIVSCRHPLQTVNHARTR